MNQSEKVEATIIAGFLGAGKTTLLRRILSWEGNKTKTVVIVNEFGEIGIDSLLIGNAGSEVFELPGGCVCCSLKPDLKRLLKKILSQINPRRIFLESTGVADPAAIIESFQAKELSPHVHLNKVITVLEADIWSERESLGSFFLNQLKESSMIILNKIDCVHENQISRILEEIHGEIPDKPVIPAMHCDIDPELLFADVNGEGKESDLIPHFVRICDSGFNKNPEQASNGKKPPYVSFTFVNSKPLDEECFKQFADALPLGLFRMKGPVRFKDRTVMVNYASGKSEWKESHGMEETRLAFVGLNVDGEEMIHKLGNCLSQNE